MDWFSLIAEIGAKNKEGSVGEESDALQSTSVGKNNSLNFILKGKII